MLESNHPAVVRTVALLWGHPELTDFIERVAAGLDPRLAHIEPAALAELMLLGEIHRLICPRHDRRIVDDPPDRAAGRRVAPGGPSRLTASAGPISA